MSNLSLLSDFPPVSTEAWEQAIREDLKGSDDEKLRGHFADGFEAKLFYRAEDLAGLGFINTAPGDFPYVRGTDSTANWRIREEIDAANPEEANKAARSAIAAGAEEIAYSRVPIANVSDLAMLTANLEEVPLRLERIDQGAMCLLVERLKKRPVSAQVSTGMNWDVDAGLAAEMVSAAPRHLVPFTFSAKEFQDRGATTVEEAGWALASGVDFLAAMQERGVLVDRAADSITFSFAMGPDFFLQIAKLRAFRMLWARAVEIFGGSREHAKACIYARTSRWNRTVYDPQVNTLRGTTEAMSAILGGANSVYIAPFDTCYRPPEEASRRLARNAQIILKLEALLARVIDPGGGSYYLETLTNSIAEAAWKLLQEIEAQGGYRNAAQKLAQALKARDVALKESVLSCRRVLVGTNRFDDASEQALPRVDRACIEDFPRAAEPLERIRLRTERHLIETGKKPRVLVAEIGNAKTRGVRSSFAADFLACAGLRSEIGRFENAQQIAAADADLIVLCSSDAEYLPLARQLAAAFHAREKEVPVLVAGNPENAEQLRAAGIAGFLHLHGDFVEVLTRVQQWLGIEIR